MKHQFKILLIEDEQTLADMYLTKFVSDGFAVERAVDGEQGLEMAKTFKPDIILCDVIMPKLDGFRVLQELKSNQNTKKIPVIMLTNLAQDEDKKKAMEYGAQGYITKANQTISEITTQVKQLLG